MYHYLCMSVLTEKQICFTLFEFSYTFEKYLACEHNTLMVSSKIRITQTVLTVKFSRDTKHTKDNKQVELIGNRKLENRERDWWEKEQTQSVYI